MQFDKKDRIIISMHSKKPDVSQEEIGSAVGLSQPSVAARIRKLRSARALVTHTGVEPLSMGLYMAKVDVSCNDTSEILQMFKDCPYFANGFTVSGRSNLCLLFVSESIATLEAIVNNHLRSKEGVKDVDFNIIINSEKEVVVPLNLSLEENDIAPCGVNIACSKCSPFIGGRCMGCPATGQYQGWLY